MPCVNCLVVIICLCLAQTACGSDSDGPDPSSADSGPGGADGSADAASEEEDHYLMPAVAHTGFDGTNVYQVPVYTTVEDAQFAVGDDSVATIEPVELSPELEDVLGTFGKSWAMITTQQAGTTAVFATAGAVELEATLVVAAYDAGDNAVGEQRYHDPADANTTDRIACVSCHGGPDGVDHTPLATAYFTDADILGIVQDGMYPEGGEVNAGNHMWNFTEAEAAGIVPYLRSLEPRGFQ